MFGPHLLAGVKLTPRPERAPRWWHPPAAGRRRRRMGAPRLPRRTRRRRAGLGVRRALAQRPPGDVGPSRGPRLGHGGAAHRRRAHPHQLLLPRRSVAALMHEALFCPIPLDGCAIVTGGVGGLGASIAGALLGAVDGWFASTAAWLLGLVGSLLVRSTEPPVTSAWFAAHRAAPLRRGGTHRAARAPRGRRPRARARLDGRAVPDGAAPPPRRDPPRRGRRRARGSRALGDRPAHHDARVGLRHLAARLAAPARARLRRRGRGAGRHPVLVAGLVIAGSLMLWIELVVRAAAVTIATAVLPLVLASTLWPPAVAWARRLAEVLFALIVSKAVIVLVLTSRSTPSRTRPPVPRPRSPAARCSCSRRSCPTRSCGSCPSSRPRRSGTSSRSATVRASVATRAPRQAVSLALAGAGGAAAFPGIDRSVRPDRHAPGASTSTSSRAPPSTPTRRSRRGRDPSPPCRPRWARTSGSATTSDRASSGSHRAMSSDAEQPYHLGRAERRGAVLGWRPGQALAAAAAATSLVVGLGAGGTPAAVLGVVGALGGIAVAAVSWHGRGLDEWVPVALGFACRPRRGALCAGAASTPGDGDVRAAALARRPGDRRRAAVPPRAPSARATSRARPARRWPRGSAGSATRDRAAAHRDAALHQRTGWRAAARRDVGGHRHRGRRPRGGDVHDALRRRGRPPRRGARQGGRPRRGRARRHARPADRTGDGLDPQR